MTHLEAFKVATGHALDGRSWFCTPLGYSPARMVVAGSDLTRENVLERVRARILGVARRGLSVEEAEDLAQETLLLLTTKYANVEAPEELIALGITIVRKLRSAQWRRAARRRDLGHVAPPPRDEDGPDLFEGASGSMPDPETLARVGQRVRLFTDAADRLSGRCRDMLKRKLEGESFVEIAKSLGRPVNTVYSWDHRCHKRLKELLGAHLGFVTGEEER
jgi:RNA polymerase sigma factor (sigma-70 family)